MRTIEEKLASLNATSVWYFAKQDTNFDNAFKAVQIVDELGQQWEDDGTTAWSTKAASKGLDSNHRILSVAQLLGLLTKNNPFEKSQYKSETPTPVFRAISRYAIGSPEYNALKTEQLLKLRMNAITDTRPESADYNIAPVLFTYEVFWRLKAKGITEISLGDFYTYVMTCKTHDEIDECVEHLLDPNRKETPYVANYKGDSRVVTLIQNNLNLIQFTATTVSIKPEFANYFGYFFNGAYTSFVNMMKFVVTDVQMYQTVLTNPIGLSVNFLDTSTKIDIGAKRVNLENRKTISGLTQQIYYGAPGTGKSHTVKIHTEGESVVRTTFHPDSDYSTFVGCYKPTTKEVEMRDVTGKVIIEHGRPVTEKRIIYQFVDQAFLQAYIKAWKFYTETLEGADPKKQFLIIEEINRGNCAQIFGDLFQLLDRNDYGFSDYYIHADRDMQKHLAKAFNGIAMNDSHKNTINAMYHNGERDIVAQVLNGEILLLPNNLYIWATMNTSDQSLFPIDSAFKRRWDWKYRPIVKGRDKDGSELNWRIMADTKEYDWWSFLEKINAIVGTTTNSEDKKLGFFFCKSIDGVISTETFVGKVIFYLWNDVFKNIGFDDPIFKDEDGSTLEFDKFYTTDIYGNTIVRTDKVERFLENLKVKVAGEIITEIEDEDGNTNSTSTRDYTKYSINGVGKYGKNILAAECVKEYIKLNPEMSVEDVLANWKSLGYIVTHFVESKEEHDTRTDNSIRSVEIPCGDTFVYVEKNGYGNNGAVDKLIAAVNQKDWNIKINKVE